MKAVILTDQHGMKHRYLIPDDFPERQAEAGLPQDPPPFLELLDWEGMGRAVWNSMIETGIVDWRNHQASPGVLPNIVKLQILNPLINLLKAETRNRVSPNGKPDTQKEQTK